MKISTMFQKSIDRPINGVIKVMQELDRTYQERKVDMINVAQALDQLSEKYLTK